MNAEKKTVARKYRPWADPNIPFGLAIAVIIYSDIYALREGLIYGPEGSLFGAFCFFILRYSKKGWWRLLRAIAFCILFLGFGLCLTGLEVYPSSAADSYVIPALFALSLWLYLT
jgi:hypothetical protein